MWLLDNLRQYCPGSLEGPVPIGLRLGLYWLYRDNRKLHGNYYSILLLYWDNGEQNGNYYNGVIGFRGYPPHGTQKNRKSSFQVLQVSRVCSEGCILQSRALLDNRHCLLFNFQARMLAIWAPQYEIFSSSLKGKRSPSDAMH